MRAGVRCNYLLLGAFGNDQALLSAGPHPELALRGAGVAKRVIDGVVSVLVHL